MTTAARSAFAKVPTRFVRTTRHPAVDELVRHGVEFTSFDGVYDQAESFDATYAAIVDALVDAAERAQVVLYAVPGSPWVAERTVELLRRCASAGEIELEVLPGLSFVDLAAAAVGRDPSTVRVVDAHAVTTTGTDGVGALLFVQVDDQQAASAVKLHLLEAMPAETPVTVLQRLGTTNEVVQVVALEDLDRGIEWDHLSSVFVDTGTVRVASEFAQLVELAQMLRAPGGCPWDREQTHHSLARHVLEEAYETVEAISALPANAGTADAFVDVEPGAEAHFEEELGDLLFQVVIQSVIAEERGAFTIADVARGIHDKLVYRHPHVFGDVAVANASEVLRNWEELKRAEKGRKSVFDGIDASLPALLHAQKVVRKAEALGVVPELDVVGAAQRLATAARGDGVSPEELEEALGELLAAAAIEGRRHGLDAETLLRAWSNRLAAAGRAAEAAAGSGTAAPGAGPAPDRAPDS